MWRSVLAWLSIAGLVTLLLWGLYQTPVAEDFQRRTFAWYQTDPNLFSELALAPLPWLQYLVFSLVAFGVTWVVIDIPRTSHRILFSIFVMAVIAGLSPTCAVYSILFEPISGMVATLLSLGLGLVYTGSEWGRRKHLLRRVFGGRISRSNMARLVNQADAPDLSGEQYEVVILTVRLFEHRELSENLDGHQLVELSNQFLQASSEFLCGKGAYLDESAPECVRAFFGIPVGSANLNRQACKAAIELRQRLTNFAVEAESKWSVQVRFGIALCSGEVSAGLFGGHHEKRYSAVGGGVALSRRLADTNPAYDTRLLVDDTTYLAGAELFEFRPIGRFQLPGSDVVTEYYELLGASDEVPNAVMESRDHFWKGVIQLRDKKGEEAYACFQQARKALGKNGSDPTLLQFLEEARALCKTSPKTATTGPSESLKGEKAKPKPKSKKDRGGDIQSIPTL